MTTGHNELSLSNTFTSALNKENVDYETVNLMDLDAILTMRPVCSLTVPPAIFIR